MSLSASGRRAPLAMAVALTLMGGSALAATLSVAPDGSQVTPVEKYRAEALERIGTKATEDEKASLKGLTHVKHFPMPRIPETAKDDQGTDVEFYSPTVRRRLPNGRLAPGGGTEQRDYAIVGAYDRGAFIYDITDPENTRFVTQILCNQRQNDIQIKQFGKRWVVMLSNDRSGDLCVEDKNVGELSEDGGAAVFDVTDPYAPKPMYNLRVRDGVHNWTWHPTAPVGWVSTGDLPGGVDHLPVYDFSDVDNPKLVSDAATEGGPHDITFSADGKTGYVASENNVRVYDTTDPRNPRITFRGPTIASYVHGADPTPDGKTLLVTDESLVLGGFFAARTAVCPGGGITLFDTQTPGRLEPLSYLVADIEGQSPDHRACTAHVGRFTPDSKHYVTGWYLGGVRLFDISDPSAPKEIGHAMMPGSEVWSAKFHKGQYVYTGDLGRGFDVYRVDSSIKLGTPPVAKRR